MNPFGFGNVEQKGVQPLYYELKEKASNLAIELMFESGITHHQMRDVCMSTLLNYRVSDKKECIKAVKLLYSKHYEKFTKLLVAIQNLEQYINRTTQDLDEDEIDGEEHYSIFMTVLGLVGYSAFHDQDKFISMIDDQ